MNAADSLRVFRASPWASDAEIDAFALEAEGLESADILRLLQLLTVTGAPGLPGHELRVRAFERLAERFPDKRLFPHFVAALRGADAALRAALALLLPRMNSILDHPALCALMRSPDAELRATAASVLNEVGAKTAFDLLSEMVREPGLEGRREIVGVLVAIGEHRAVVALHAALGFGSAEDRIHTIDQLASARCMARDAPAAARAVASALDDPMEAVAVHAVATLAGIASEAEYFESTAPLFASSRPSLVAAAVSGLSRFASERSVDMLQEKLLEGPQLVRFAAIEALESIGTPDVLKPLAETLGHGQIAVRMKAAEALARLSAAGRLDLARTVVWLLRSKDADIRRLAVELAQSVRDPHGELWPKLLGCLRDEDWWVRERLADVLISLAGPALLPHVLPYLQDPAPVMRQFAVDMITRLHVPDALGALLTTAINDADWWVRERAVDAIAAQRDARSVPYLADIMLREAELRIACLQALEALGKDALEAEEAVVGQLATRDEDVQLAALRCLKALGSTQHADTIRASLKDPSHTVRALARDVLQELQARLELPAAQALDTLSFLDKLLLAVSQRNCDDLILAPGRQPYVTRYGSVAVLAKDALRAEDVSNMLLPHLSPQQTRGVRAGREADFSYVIPEHGLRFRVNVFEQLGGLGAVFRIVKGTIPRIDELGVPAVVQGLADLKNGLVLVGGPTGSGKSTTLAAIINEINRTSARHIVTFEDPIEVVHRRDLSIVNQREIHTHTGELDQALRGTLRQDPDVILIGEMRDLPTISFAVTAAETGHLVFGTIHTSSAALTVDRLINAFPAGQHDQVRTMIAGSLNAVVCQYLLPRRDAPGRCLAVEVMLNNDAIANLIRKGKTFQIPSVMATSREAGMQLMDSELSRLCDEGKISAEDAYMKAVSKRDFEGRLAGGPTA
jgi:twitching motility protein PilT